MATAPKIGQIRPPIAPNLPIAPVAYDQAAQDKYSNALRLYFNQIDNCATGINDDLNSNKSYVEAYDRSTSIVIGTTPALLKPANFLPSPTEGIIYDPATGVFTFLYAGTYSLAISLNISASNSGQKVYVYAQKNIGAGWVNTSNSGKLYDLINNQITQFVSPQAVYRAAGEQTRYYIYSNGSTSSLVTSTLPGITPTVYVPAIRIQYAG